MLAPTKRTEWWKEIESIRRRHPEPVRPDPMYPNNIIRSLAALAPADTIVTTDVGQHQMWAAQAWPVQSPRSFLTSGGLGTMGFGVPAALGAALAHPERTVVALTGDGSLLMNIQDLATLAEHDLDVKIILFNNGHLGLVRQQQELFYEGRYTASRFERRPDFRTLARGFGIDAVRLESWDGRAAARTFERRGPMLVEMMISETENVFPMVPPGAANTAAIAVGRS
jgi:acetolactate synthase-1/2/3 large subunit